MHELTKHLERVFKAKILFISVDQKQRAEDIQTPFGNLLGYTTKPTMTVRMNVVKFDGPPTIDYLHIFRPYTQCAVVTSVKHERDVQETYQPYEVYTVEFVVYDYENFAKDLEKYSWEDFNEEFNKSLDKKLDSE